jgi:hypothetical protein
MEMIYSKTLSLSSIRHTSKKLWEKMIKARVLKSYAEDEEKNEALKLD